MNFLQPITLLLIILTAVSCGRESIEPSGFVQTGYLENIKLDEASGIQASRSRPDIYFLHNDDGKPEVFVIDHSGKNLGSFLIRGASNRDWEDITTAPTSQGPLLVLADSGDNFHQFPNIRLNFVMEPIPDDRGIYSGAYPLQHLITLEYPDGARDCESVSYDPGSERIYLMSKRDKPARLYSIALQDALNLDQAVLDYEGEVVTFRPPTANDFRRFGRQQGKWVSQPTGMDINANGTQAAIITTRSVYLFNRLESEDWPEAFARKPVEIVGPGHRQEEAIAYLDQSDSIIITAEGVRAPVFQFSKSREQD